MKPFAEPGRMLLVAAVLLGWISLLVSRSAEGARAANPASAQLWGKWEGVFTAADKADPETELTAEFTAPSGKKHIVRGFWDGDNVWRVRFMPNEKGRWRFRTASKPAVAGLDGQRGEFECRGGDGSTRFLDHGALRVSANGHYLDHADGTPFFWLVDTVWNGALLSSNEDWDRYLDNRVAKKFTGVQFVTTQWRTAYTDAEGMVAYTGFEKIRINPAFFQRMDKRIDAVNAKGLLAVPVLLWTLGSEKVVPGRLPESEAIRLARYQVARYQANHVVYFLPGDGNYFGENAERWKRIGRAVFDQPRHAPATLHPQGMQWPWDAFLQEKWVNIFGYQSGHGDDANTLRWIHSGPPSQKWNQKPYRPVINLEPPYEDHIAYQSRQRHTAYSVRRATYWSLLNAPTAGVSYGAHGVWSWESRPKEPQEHGGTGVAQPWFKAMDFPGSHHMRHMAELFTSIRWWELRPDNSFFQTPATGSVTTELAHIVYTRDKSGGAALYLDGKKVSSSKVSGDLSNWNASFRLALANELTRDRPWLGEFHQIAIYDTALGDQKVAENYKAGRQKTPEAALVLYTFREGSGDAIKDVSGSGQPLNLKIENAGSVKWLPKGGLAVQKPGLIASAGPGERKSLARFRNQTPSRSKRGSSPRIQRRRGRPVWSRFPGTRASATSPSGN
jgi:hypothetical protein